MLSLTATDLPRYVRCNGSRLLEKIPPFHEDDTLRKEGDAAHWLVEQDFKGNFSAIELVDRKAPNGVIIDADMLEYCDQYLSAIKGHGEVEIDTSYSGENWEIRGRSDHISLQVNTLYIRDFKYGWKIVDAFENWTLISHAIGWLSRNPCEVHEIVFMIYQPRPFHPDGPVREWRISTQELWERWWVKLKTALENSSDFLHTGDHCYKCPSMGKCPAFQIASMNAIEHSCEAFNSEIASDELAKLIEQTNRAFDVIKQSKDAYEELAMHRLKKGELVGDFAVESQLSNLKWKNGMNVSLVKLITGKDLSKQQLVTPIQAMKTEGVDPEVIKTLSEKVSTKAKLVKKSVSQKGRELFGTKKS